MSEEHTHPSYGMLLFSRVSHGGRTRLFGSAIKEHHTTIRLQIAPGIWEHDLHHDRYFTRGMRPFIEVEMSAAQFAEALTTMNMSSGVPCTILWNDGKRIEEPPDILNEVERIKADFTSDLDGMVAKVNEYRAKIDKLTAGKLSGKAKEEVRVCLDVMTQQLSSNIPFIAEQFNRASDRVVTAAKAEIEAFAMHTVHTAGLNALAEAKAAPAQLEAPKCGAEWRSGMLAMHGAPEDHERCTYSKGHAGFCSFIRHGMTRGWVPPDHSVEKTVARTYGTKTAFVSVNTAEGHWTFRIKDEAGVRTGRVNRDGTSELDEPDAHCPGKACRDAIARGADPCGRPDCVYSKEES